MRQLVYRARSGVRSALTAVIPLPLITRLVVAAGAPPATAAVGLGAAGGGAATIAKVIAVIGVAAATVGATHTLQGDHQPRHTRSAPTSHAPTTTAERGGLAAAFGVQQAAVNEQSGPTTGDAAGQNPGGQHQTGSQTGSSAGGQSGSSTGGQSGSSAGGQGGSSQQGFGNNTTHQSGSQTRAAWPAVNSPERSNRPPPAVAQSLRHPARATDPQSQHRRTLGFRQGLGSEAAETPLSTRANSRSYRDSYGSVLPLDRESLTSRRATPSARSEPPICRDFVGEESKGSRRPGLYLRSMPPRRDRSPPTKIPANPHK
jgi:hypothetical protein